MGQTASKTPQQIQQELESLTPEQVESRVTASAALMSYEAKYALQQVREFVDSDRALEIVEPLARALGWAEAFAFTELNTRMVSHGNSGRTH